MLSARRVIAASPRAVWELLVDLDAWPQWGPSVSGAELDSPHLALASGVTGVVHTPAGLRLPFTVTDFDPGRYWAWQVAGIPATSHRVDPAPGGARVTMSVPWWAPAYLAVCALALRRIAKLLPPAH